MTRSALHLDGVQNLKGFRLFFFIFGGLLNRTQISVTDITDKTTKFINMSQLINHDGVFFAPLSMLAREERRIQVLSVCGKDRWLGYGSYCPL